ncbi:expansin-b4 [Phtheirospermum japonicum]|uniref:Expansin-b4 n=1 Tax=Phtheirospermum japonicum TaxID=374723 RepID=A0A830D7Z9_9LAMI|nr:expansin-b4 [Phtheirospermum japonicum]GFQ02532.1 expansin-b4 [Phtheirospermum japonicum]
MFTSEIARFFNLLTIVTLSFLLTDHCCFCINSQSTNDSIANGFSQAVATWYGIPTGSGSAGGACGFENDVANPPYNGLISAGNQFLFKSGRGCGNCYQLKVKCTDHPQCSGYPITVTITDECPGACNNEPVHFDLSGKAFGYLAKQGQGDALRNLGRINIQYQSVPCNYNVGITFKIDTGSNKYYLAFAIEFVGGDGDIGSVEISNSKGSLAMQQSFGATWKVGLPEGISGPYSVKVTTIESKKVFYASNVIPANWAPGQRYRA